jgi:protein SCO1/2
VVALAAFLIAGCGPAASELPPFALTDQSGRLVRPEELRGRAVLVSFIFTTCVEACPIVTAQLARVQAEARAAGLTPRLRFVSISVDPVTDTPERLREYAKAYGADLDSWHFLTGRPEDVAGVMRSLGVGTAPGKRGLAHDAPVIFVDARGRVVERQDALALVPDRALATLRRLAG